MPKHFVLVGGGHAHLTMLIRCRDYVERGVRVTLISPSRHHYYSGMGPGLLAGTYRPQDIRFNVGKTAMDRGAAFLEDRVINVDAEKRELRLQSGRTLGYDVVSFNTGSEVVSPEGFRENPIAYTVKPIVSLLSAQQTLISLMQRGPADIIVVGGGPAGLEIAGNAWRLARNRKAHAHITLIAESALLEDFAPRVQAMARQSLLRRGIAIRDQCRAATFERDAVVLTTGERLHADVILVATGIRPTTLFKDSGLPVGPDNGLLVNRFLQSTVHPEVFGGGDAVSFEPRPLAKVGVYAVRENEILYRNTLALLTNGALVPFEPQRDFMLIFNMGDDRAILTRGNFAWDGRLAWKIKDRIDRSFMRKFQVSGERNEPFS